MRGDPVDRFFRYEHGIWPSTRERWLESGFPAEVGCYPDQPGFVEHFDFDPVYRIAINSGYTDSPYYPRFERETLQEDGVHVFFRGDDGIVKRMLREHRDTSMPQFVRFPVTSRADWEAVRRRLRPEDAGERIGDLGSLAEQCADCATVPTILPMCGAFGHPRNLLGDEGLGYVIYDDPDLLDEILDNWYELYAELLTSLTRQVRVDCLLIWEDMCYKNGPLIGPRHFRHFMLPRYRALIRTARDCDIECVLVDSDGDVSKMIPIFLEAGVDAMFPFEVQAGMDVVKVREQFGRTFCIMGGIDKRALAKAKRDIEAELARVVPFFLESGRFIPTLDHTVPIDVPYENFLYYLDVLRSYERAGPIP
jgi:uroporphyrinogen decarboxylase